MNLLRLPTRVSVKRAYATGAQFVPPASMRDMDRSFNEKSPSKPKPDSPSFYTGRATYYDQLISLETAIKYSRHALTTLQLYPLPSFARASLPPLHPVWKDRAGMSLEMNTPLNTMRYRRVTALLNQLNDFQRIAYTAGALDLFKGINQIVMMFEKSNKQAILARGKRKPVQFDKYGRTYTVGRRKTSSARVWMIPIRSQVKETAPVEDKPESSPVNVFLGLRPEKSPSSPTAPVTPTTILVNNRLLAEYFPVPGDREKVIRPLKVTGALAAYNVFAITRGGGTTGQSGAIAQGIAKGLAAHDPTVETILKKAKLMRRDPRMVERKKTGWAKARKRYTWVKR